MCGSRFLLHRLFKLGEPSHSRIKMLKQWYHLTQNYCWLICSLPLSLPVPAWACPCRTHAHKTWWLSCCTLFLSTSSHVTARPFLRTFYTELKRFYFCCCCSVSLRVDQVTLFVSASEYADFFPDVNLFINHSALTYPHHQHVMHKRVLGPVSLPFDIYPKKIIAY